MVFTRMKLIAGFWAVFCQRNQLTMMLFCSLVLTFTSIGLHMVFCEFIDFCTRTESLQEENCIYDDNKICWKKINIWINIFRNLKPIYFAETNLNCKKKISNNIFSTGKIYSLFLTSKYEFSKVFSLSLIFLDFHTEWSKKVLTLSFFWQ